MSWLIVEWVCETCGARTESLEDRGTVHASKECQVDSCFGVAERAISAPKVKTVWGWSTPSKFGSEERPPGALDTRAQARRGGVDI